MKVKLPLFFLMLMSCHFVLQAEGKFPDDFHFRPHQGDPSSPSFHQDGRRHGILKQLKEHEQQKEDEKQTRWYEQGKKEARSEFVEQLHSLQTELADKDEKIKKQSNPWGCRVEGFVVGVVSAVTAIAVWMRFG